MIAALELGGAAAVERDFDRAIVAIGITGNVEGIGLETTAARVEKGHVVVDRWRSATLSKRTRQEQTQAETNPVPPAPATPARAEPQRLDPDRYRLLKKAHAHKPGHPVR